MSYDFNTRTSPCPHTISGERYVVDTADFRTLHYASDIGLNMRAPANGLSMVTVRIQGELVQPGDPVYGYSILADQNRVNTSDRFYKIVFNRPVRWFIPLIEVGYITLQPYCLRCSAQGVLNDYKPGSNGSFQRVVNTDELAQRVLKYVLTSRCQFYPQFTCKIRDYLGRKNIVTEDDISMQIMDTLTNLKNVQTAQATVQTVSPLERLKDVTGISVLMPDPTSVSVSCSVTSYGTQSTPVPINFSVSSTRQLVGAHNN